MSAIYNECLSLCMCKNVSSFFYLFIYFFASSSMVCMSVHWLAVGLLVAHIGWKFMISIFRLA